LLKGFEFNANARLGGTLYAPFTPSATPTDGGLAVNIPSFLPINMLAAPAGATHFKIVMGGADVDFGAEFYVNGTAASAELPIDATPTAVLNLSVKVPGNSKNPQFIVLGVEFYQEINKKLYSLKNGAYNALAVVMVYVDTTPAPPVTPPPTTPPTTPPATPPK
jgi:hypothetical protein